MYAPTFILALLLLAAVAEAKPTFAKYRKLAARLAKLWK